MRNREIKYIIKNCPAGYSDPYSITPQRCVDKKPNIYCQDCTDCLLKRIISRLKNFAEDYGLDAGFYADELLSLLDIQEVE